MFKNFIIITLRSLWNNKVYTFINILGLAIGMAGALLIGIYLLKELSYDNFHKDSERIFRITTIGKLKGKDINIAMSSGLMGKALKEEINCVEEATRIARIGAWLIANDSIRYNEDAVLFADSNFFRLFSFKFVYGNPDSALKISRSMVITRSTARKYFGNRNPVGEKLKVERDTILFTVTAMIEDLPANSHFHFDIMGSLKTYEKFLNNLWLHHNVYTYFKVAEKTDIHVLEKQINQFVGKYVSPEIEEYLGISQEEFNKNKNAYRFVIQPLRKIHLHSHLDVELENNANPLYVYTFGIIALLILIIACLNFINLSTASSANRAREVILRKVIGSERIMLIAQFITESVIFSYIALIISFLIVELTIPFFNNYLEIGLEFNLLINLPVIILILCFTFLLGIIAGCYPAFIISSYDPVRVLHGKLNKGVKNKKIRSVFVTFQFFVSILIIILSQIVFAQVHYMLNKELGFEKNRIVVVRRPDALKEKIDNFKEDILSSPNIEAVTNSNSIPGRDFRTSAFIIDTGSGRVNVIMNQIFVGPDFNEALGLKMSDGRFFAHDKSDSNTCVINETAARIIGVKNPIGKYLLLPGYLKKEGIRISIIGIVKDFHFQSVDKEIEPLVISLMPGNWEGYLNVRVKGDDLDKSIKFLEKTWSKYTSEYPFVYFFLDQDFDQNYRSVINTGKILFMFSILSLFVACLGLFGLMLFTSFQRMHEIGIRKAVGASFYQIIYLLVKETVYLIIIASLFAWSVAWIFSKIWLREFNTRIDLSPKYFIIATGIAFILGLAVVFYQCFIAAKCEPGDALKSE
jgi:putative ABC transport system permease protein